MKHRHRKKKQIPTRGSWFIPGCLVMVMVFAVLVARRDPVVTTNPPNVPPPLPAYSKEEVHRFWESHMHSLIVDQLGGERHPIPEVNARYRTLLERIRRKFPMTPLKIMAVERFNDQSPSVYMGVNTEEPVPRLAIYVPAFMRRWGPLLPDPVVRKDLESSVIVGIFHEMEHMTHPKQGTPSREELVLDEAATWAETCSASMPILLEGGYPLGSDHRAYYERWQTCGRSNNACWREFIGVLYAPLASNPAPAGGR